MRNADSRAGLEVELKLTIEVVDAQFSNVPDHVLNDRVAPGKKSWNFKQQPA